LDAHETATYLRHRYRVAGGLHLPFDAGAIKRIHAHSGGVPRLINVISERALLGGYAHDDTRIDARTVDRAAREALAPKASAWPARRWLLPGGVGVAALALVAGVYAWRAPPAAPAAKPMAATLTASPVAPAGKALPTRHVSPAALDADALTKRIGDAAAASPLAWQQLLQAVEAAVRQPQHLHRFRPAPSRFATDAYCVRAHGTLDRLVAQDRPVLLHLRSGTQEAWAVLLGADARNARVSLDGHTLDIERLALGRHWTANTRHLWRGPANLTLPVAGQTPSLTWVRDRLTTRYLPAVPSPPSMPRCMPRCGASRATADSPATA
jgi:general secretion pathway protein A